MLHWAIPALGGALAAVLLSRWSQHHDVRHPFTRTSGDEDFRAVGPDGYDWQDSTELSPRYLEFLGAYVPDADLCGTDASASSNDKGLDCSIRIVPEGSRWRAIATCSTAQGPFTLEATADEKTLAGLVGPVLAREAAQDTAKKNVLAQVGALRWGRARREELFYDRLAARDPYAMRLAPRLRERAAQDPNALAFWNRLLAIHRRRGLGRARRQGWAFPTQMVAGIDLDSQRRPRKSLPEHTLRHLHESMRRAH